MSKLRYENLFFRGSLVIAGLKSLYESFNAGKNWKKIYDFDYDLTFITAVEAYDFSIWWYQNNIYIGDGNTALISEDNGKKWKKTDQKLEGVKIKSSGIGLGKESGELYKTSDFGVTWEKLLTLEDEVGVSFDFTPDGKNITLAYGENPVNLQISANEGKDWQKFTEIFVGGSGPQDILIDPNNSKHILLFVFMKGLFESFNSGEDWQVVSTETYENMTILKGKDYGLAIVPLDLRLDKIKSIVIPGDNMILPNRTAYLLPTDQGLFLYDSFSKTLGNITSDLYLGDTGYQISITSCPSVFAGLWHLGQFSIVPDGSIETVNSYSYSEMWRAVKGEDMGCETPIMFNGLYGTYYHGNPESALGYPIKSLHLPLNRYAGLMDFYDGWWYAVTNGKNGEQFVRHDKILKNNEILSIPTDGKFIFYIEKNKAGATFWIMDTERSLWKSIDLKNWIQMMEGASSWDGFPYPNGNFFVKSNLIIWSNNLSGGFYVSQDGGKTKNLFFEGAEMSNVVENNGRIFVGLKTHFPHGYGDENQSRGVYYSDDSGSSWKLYGKGAEKSYINSLEIDKTTNTLWASTPGESLLKIGL